ncbi:hypothetical protein BCR36DRAFT_291533 [Piromyces finnis]|uniref:Uncharacterized protein n=1 Tax=Piromyces finnis TaxID=1754191 RepID=A0A1Y1V8F2_9FUNG|nr:hypothetical protein BCR36DRAFT_291533 [Piromyces finnis]|eukprot:ORX49709.1 hypothetical protein BCR36DRAFT_291533 [Piromyces finnis]
MYSNPTDTLNSNYIISTYSILEEESSLTIRNSDFKEIYGEKGFLSSEKSSIKIENSEFSKNFLKYGIFTINKSIFPLSGTFTINNCNFVNNEGVSGSIFYINDVENVSFPITISSSLFQNNKSKVGGIIYSISRYTQEFVKFISCKFNNNKANLGSISYSLNANTEPYFSNYSELKINKSNFSTNPTYIVLNTIKKNNEFSILSGDTLEGTISLIIFPSDFKSMSSDDLVLFEISTNDTDNSLIIGQYRGYCWGSSCDITNVKVIGNTGSYTLTFRILTFGLYHEFKHNYENFNVIINECNDTFLYRNRDDSKFKSW